MLRSQDRQPWLSEIFAMGPLWFFVIVCGVIALVWAMLIPADSYKALDAFMVGKWPQLERITWTSRKICFLAQLLIALCWFYFTGHQPLPGYAIAFLGAAAAVMAFRAEAGSVEKVVWIVIVFVLLILELMAIKAEHDRQDETSQKIIRQGLLLSQQMQSMQRLPAETATTEKVIPPVTGEKTSGAILCSPGPASIVPPSIPSNAGKVFVNVDCENVGTVTVNEFVLTTELFIYGGPPETLTPQAIDEYFRRLLLDRDLLKKMKAVSSLAIAPKEKIWQSPTGPEMTPDLLGELNKGEKTLLVVGKYTYKDAVGRHTYDLCDWLQAPVNTAQPIWHYCHVHQK